MTPTTEYGPGLNGWPAHGYTDTRYGKITCYCTAEFTSKMALNQHAEQEARAAALRDLAATIAILRAALDECRRLADPGAESDAPTDGRGQRLNWIWRTASRALAAKETP